MRKTILTLAMMLMLAFAATAGPTIKATPANKAHVALKGDSIVISSGDEQVTLSGVDLQKVNKKINDALDDTLSAGGTTVQIGSHSGDLTPEDIKAMNSQWAHVVKRIAYASIIGLIALVAVILNFRLMNRRSRYRVIEKAIENNYPLNELSLNDVKRSAIYVQQPVVTSAPQPQQPQPGQVPVGTPLEGRHVQSTPAVMTDMVNWRALMPAVKWIGWGIAFIAFSIIVVGDHGSDPFLPIGIALAFVGLCKGFILYKEQQALQEALRRAQDKMPPQEPMREGIPVPPPMDDDYKEDDSNTYQPY